MFQPSSVVRSGNTAETPVMGVSLVYQ